MNKRLTTPHLTNDELIDRLYGITENGHVDECAECQVRLDRMIDGREMAAEPVEVSREFLAAQRRQIYSRLGERPGVRMKWAPALAAACVVVVGVLAFRPVPAPQTEIADSQLFADVYSMEQTMEPRAAEPIHALFDSEQ